ncbi:MAG: MlaD family protein [Aliarcobacter sp.]|jgi:phospholipid/cholesterol/gamma-HCH transport system substrate-binding protein|nr:MlaD family protein [Aliarcobacter sp.]
MDTKISFFKIGMFIVIFTIALLGVIFWLGKYGFEKQKFDEYSIYFEESISGLNIGSSIKYKGFEVGSVNEIKINPDNSEEIQIDILIKKGTPIKEDNYAILGSLGITGLKYIELKGGTHESALLKVNEEGFKVIPSKVSALTSLFDSTQDITTEVMLVLNQIRKVLDDKNIDKFSQLLLKGENSLINIEQLTEYLITNEKKIDTLLKDISGLVKTSNKSFESVNKSADSFKELSTEFLTELNKGTFNIKDLSQESFDKLNNVLNSLDETLLRTQKLVDDLNQSPSDILFKQKTIKYGPGEIDEK